MISTTPQSFHHLVHVGMISNSSALHFLLKKKFFFTNNKFIARECLCDSSFHFFNLLLLWTQILLAYVWKVRQGNLGSVGIAGFLQFKRKTHNSLQSLFISHNIPGHFNPNCELTLLQSTLDQAMVHNNSLYLGKERSILKNGIHECIYYISSICSSEYYAFIYISETVSFLKQFQC